MIHQGIIYELIQSISLNQKVMIYGIQKNAHNYTLEMKYTKIKAKNPNTQKVLQFFISLP